MMMTAPSACRHSFARTPAPGSRAVLRIEGMPRRLRATVEELMVRCLPTQAPLAEPGADPLTAAWCTDWRPDGLVARAVRCREVLVAPAAELDDFARRLARLAHSHGFTAELSRLRARR